MEERENEPTVYFQRMYPIEQVIEAMERMVNLSEESEVKNMNKKAMELRDTVGMMNSENYKVRFKAEYYQLGIRLFKLKSMLENWDNGSLNFTPTCPRKLYDIQVRSMEDYLAVLEARASIEQIDLNH